MDVIHYFRIGFLFLLICLNGSSVVHANYDWQKFETLLENGQHLVAIKQLDKNLKQARARRDDEEWTLTLLRGASLRTINGNQSGAINYLLYSTWPSNKLSQSILNLALAKEFEQYLMLASKPFSGFLGSKTPKKANKLSHAQLFDKINRHYQLAFDIANKNNLTTKQAQAYITPGNYPDAVRGRLADVIVAYWQQFLADETYWTSQQKNALNDLKLAQLTNLTSQNISNLKHPLLRAKQLSQQVIAQYARNGRTEAVFEAKRFYAQLLFRHFSCDKSNHNLSDFLSNQLEQLDPKYPWWTMGKFQLLSFKKHSIKSAQLSEIYDLAVEASNTHTDSLGAKKSQRLIHELELIDYMITGIQSSEINKPSIEIEFKNLQKLYFRAWRGMKPLPVQIEDEDKSTIISALLTKEVESEWVANLSDQSDLHRQTIQHKPKINRYGHWLILASPNENFQEAKSELQLISMQFSQLVASVNYANETFSVAVYNYENGLPQPGISVDLISAIDDVEEILFSTKTDENGIARLQRQTDSEHFRVYLHSGDHHSIIEIPGLLSLKEEKFWSLQARQGKSLLFTDKNSYLKDDIISWSIISRANATKGNISMVANANQKASLRLFDEAGHLVFKKHFTTDQMGTASGKITLSNENIPKLFSDPLVEQGQPNSRVFRIETNLGDQKAALLIPVQNQAITEIKTVATINLQRLKALYEENETVEVLAKLEGVTSLKTPQAISWSLIRTSTTFTGELYASLEIDRGKAISDDSGQFNFKTSLSLGNDTHHKLRHNFNLSLKYIGEDSLPKIVEKRLFLNDKKSYYSLLNSPNFFVVGEAVNLVLLRNNILSQGLAGESQWTIYKLPQPESVSSADFTKAKLLSSQSITDKKRTGTIVHDGSGKSKLVLKQLELGQYKLRVMPKNMSEQPVFEHHFTVSKNGVSDDLKLSGAMVAEKSEFDANTNNLRFLAGSGHPKQWSRLTISRGNKQLSSEMLSPGTHLLSFPVNESHQGGVNFSLEWVEKNRISHREIDVKVPWGNKRLLLSLDKTAATENPNWRLNVLDNNKNALAEPVKSKILLYFTEVLDADGALPKQFNLNDLYVQSGSSVMRLNSNEISYPHLYNNKSKQFPSYISDIVELPRIRYSPDNDGLLLASPNNYFIPSRIVESQSTANSVTKLVPQVWNLARLSKPANHMSSKLLADKQRFGLTHFLEASLDVEGGLTIELPEKLKGKRVHLRAIVVTPDLKTGQLSVTLR